MKNVWKYLLVFLISTLMVGCGREEKQPRVDGESIDEPVIHDMDYFCDGSLFGLAYTGTNTSNDTKFADETATESAEPTDDTLSVTTWDHIHYKINGKEYVVLCTLTSDRDESPADRYGWSADRSFFVSYADTTTGGRLYKNAMTDTDECYIWHTKQGTDRVLVRTDSTLLKWEDYSIDDFGAAFCYSNAVMWASDLRNVFELHFYMAQKGMDAVCSSECPFDSFFVYDIQFEYLRIPGLRYFIEVDVSCENDGTFFYSRALGSEIVVKDSALLPNWFYGSNGDNTHGDD